MKACFLVLVQYHGDKPEVVYSAFTDVEAHRFISGIEQGPEAQIPDYAFVVPGSRRE